MKEQLDLILEQSSYPAACHHLACMQETDQKNPDRSWDEMQGRRAGWLASTDGEPPEGTASFA